MIEEIYLQDHNLHEEITIAAFQLKSISTDEFEPCQNSSDFTNILDTHNKNYTNRIKKFQKIFKNLENINEKRKMKINCVVFPEYSIPEEILGDIEKFVNQSKIMVIGNFLDSKERASTSFVCLPLGWAEKKFYSAKKISRIADEAQFINETPAEQERILKLFWKPKDKQNCKSFAYFQIFTCKDFLYLKGNIDKKQNNGENPFDLQNPGIIFVPMQSTQIEPFVTESNSLLRKIDYDHEPHKKSIVTVLCNTTNDNLIDSKLYPSCGETQIVSLVKDMIKVKGETIDKKTIIPKGIEGCLVFQINIFNTIITPTTYDKNPNLVITSFCKFKLNKDLVFERLQIHPEFVINPQVFNAIRLKKIYAVGVVEKYKQLIEKIQKLPDNFLNESIAMYGVFGYYDILIQAYEQNITSNIAKQNIELRLWPLKNILDFDDKLFKIFVTTELCKYRGIIIKNKDESEHCPNRNLLKKFIKKTMLGFEVNYEKIYEYYNPKDLCIPTICDLSDRTDQEKESNLLEFVALISIKNVNLIDAKNPIEYFKEFMLEKFLADKKVRTIEILESVRAENTNQQHLMFHIVGTFDDYKQIITINLVTKCWKDIICKATLLHAHSVILSNHYPSLSEKNMDEGLEGKLNALMMEHLTLNIDPLMNNNVEVNCPQDYYFDIFAIKKIDTTISENLNSIYELCRDIDKNPHYRLDSLQRIHRTGMTLNFIFGTSELIKKIEHRLDKTIKIENIKFEDLDFEDIDKYHRFSSFFFENIGNNVEDAINRITEKILDELNLDPTEYNDILNAAGVAKSKDYEEKSLYPDPVIGTNLMGFRLLEALIDDPDGRKKFCEVYLKTHPNEKNVNAKFDQAGNIHNIICDRIGRFTKYNENEYMKYITEFGKLRNFGAHNFNRKKFERKYKKGEEPDWKKINAILIPKVVLETSKFLKKINRGFPTE